ncbi:divalent metal cation transporter [uncultured Acidaminococcus sp.]|uniref:divalent metal cation transporter n=1 Tax=uncultured Acidaminococcus sp. TaxID=352152 RepID=UPI0026321669|nr:divalent metal cation transporter [uncultured Acidaminococcus sp.]
MAEKQEKQFTLKEKLGALGPGFLIVGSFIGPGTVTSSTKAGADYGFQLFWCIIFSVIAVIVMQGMAARLGIVTQMGLAQNLVKDFENRPVLRTLLCGLVAVAITIGGFAYMSGDLTGTAIGISALTGISTRIIAPVWGLYILLLLSFAGDALKYLEKTAGGLRHHHGGGVPGDHVRGETGSGATPGRLCAQHSQGRPDDLSVPDRDHCGAL